MSARHVSLQHVAWSDDGARSTIEAIANDARAHFDHDRLWPAHPADEWCRDGETSLYWGAAGVILALDELGTIGADERAAFVEALPVILARNRSAIAQFAPLAGFDPGQASWLLGDVGVLLLQMRLTPEAGTELEIRISANLALPPLELMWGIPGTMLACTFLHAMTGEERWRRLWLAQAAKLLADLQETSLGAIWTQKLYGQTAQYLGLVHGLAGNVAALLRGWDWLVPEQQAIIRAIASRTLKETAVPFGGGLNWSANALAPAVPELVQICHGAPGVIAAFADARLDTPELRALLEDGGECIWQRGPLAKGAGFCHGTAGNGYAFLKLFALTKRTLWLDRARAFAMHAIGQWQAAMAHEGRGRGRYSLWTGDLGLAIFLRNCVEGLPSFPTLDTF